jgi:hypothetical protein
MAENIQQALQLATTNNQLAILPTFSDDSREDKTSLTEWLQKVINYKYGGGRTNLQTVTHFRNALRGEVLKWYNALPLVDVKISIGTSSEPNLNKNIGSSNHFLSNSKIIRNQAKRQ